MSPFTLNFFQNYFVIFEKAFENEFFYPDPAF